MHQDFYKNNREYAEHLRDSDPRRFQSLPRMCPGQAFHGKYERALRAVAPPGAVILDVGCGVGQVVRSLCEAGFEAHGVEISEENLALAREHPGDFRLYDGRTLPLADRSVDAVGAFNVLEHVEDPVFLLDEMARVLRPGGRMVISSPNLLRVLGWRDYHPRLRGVRQKWRNAKTLYRHRQAYRADPRRVIFEQMPPIRRESFHPDDDAIVATNALDFQQYLRSRKFMEIRVSCVDRPIPRWMSFLLDFTPLRFVMLNSFVTATKSSG